MSSLNNLITFVHLLIRSIEGLVISPSSQQSSHVTIYDPDCHNDNDYEDESYGSGSALEFHGNELEQIENPSTELINKCKDVINQFKEVI